jgi:hypothetical protein
LNNYSDGDASGGSNGNGIFIFAEYSGSSVPSGRQAITASQKIATREGVKRKHDLTYP